MTKTKYSKEERSLVLDSSYLTSVLLHKLDKLDNISKLKRFKEVRSHLNPLTKILESQFDSIITEVYSDSEDFKRVFELEDAIEDFAKISSSMNIPQILLANDCIKALIHDTTQYPEGTEFEVVLKPLNL